VNMAEEKPTIKVGTTSGIYYAARAEELANAIRKLGYTLTRGAAAMEIAADVAHEVPYSHGVEIRHMAKKQGVEVLFHGDLTVPMCIPERADWRDAHDRITKSIRSAVYAGASYIDFHASLNIWLELLTFAGRKLTTSFVDENGMFISEVMKKDKKLREWFIKEKFHIYAGQILTDKEQQGISNEVEYFRNEREEEIRGAHTAYIRAKEEFEALSRATPQQRKEAGRSLGQLRKRMEDLREQWDSLVRTAPARTTEFREKKIKAKIREKLSRGEKWDTEELRSELGVVDGYLIMGHHLFYTKDPIWLAMVEQYKDTLKGIYKPDYSDDEWLKKAWSEAERTNNRKFKEFFYAAVGAKYMEGHIRAAFEWLENDLIKKEIPAIARELAEDPEKEIKELTDIASNLRIAIENPDAREPQHAGLFLLWHVKQIYAAVKTIRKVLPKRWGDRVFMLTDWEHLANQGMDALYESEQMTRNNPDFGEITLSCHANHPNPMQPHIPLELGDELVYKLLWNLRRAGFGKKMKSYLIFERGGGDDPFKQSVDTLKLMAKFLLKDVPPAELPPEFFGVEGLTAGMFKRQLQVVRDHFFEPLKDLLEMPEEEWTALSQAAIKKGRKPEQVARGYFR
jgi:hypothetical protein